MNIENAKLLVSQLKTLRPEQFRMDTWIGADSCGTVGCIAGWCKEFNARGRGWKNDPEEFSREFLGLTYFEAADLFLGSWADEPFRLSSITLAEAIAHLEGLIATEEARP